MGHLIIDQANMICVMFTKFCSTWSRFNGFYLDRPRFTVWQVSIQGSWLGNPVDDQKFIVFKVISHTHKKKNVLSYTHAHVFPNLWSTNTDVLKNVHKNTKSVGSSPCCLNPIDFHCMEKKKRKKKKNTKNIFLCVSQIKEGFELIELE